MSSIPNSIEVCFVPALFQSLQTTDEFITVVVDVFRASTTICAALSAGVEKIIPVKSIQEAADYKKQGFVIAGEREGQKLAIANYGNSPFDFIGKKVPDQIVLTTSNGTVAIQVASGPGEVVIGAFCNLKTLSDWLISKNKNVVILCAGWLGSFSMEDSLFAGALSASLSASGNYTACYDSSKAALLLWDSSKGNLSENAKDFTHYKRLVKLGAGEDAKFALQMDTLDVIPYLHENCLINLYKNRLP
jgi:2-phosphosulfolactate phosphatase